MGRMDLVELLNGYLKTDKVAKIKHVKSNDQIQIYKIETQSSKKYFTKVAMNELSNNRKTKEIIACKMIKGMILDFPCIIPKQVACDENFSIYLEEAIEGNEISKFLDNNRIVCCVFKDLAGLLLDMHAVEVSNYNIKEISDNLINWHEFVNKSVFDYAQCIIQDNIIPNEILDALYLYWNKHESVLDNVNKFSLVHNDLNQGNILINNNHHCYCISGIIDFERCIVGDPIKDISKLVWLFRKNSYAGSVFMKEYFKEQKDSEENLIKVKLYLIWDILYHLQQQKYLLQFSEWKMYLDEEKEILNNILLKEESKLW